MSLLLLSCLGLGAPTPIASYAAVEDVDVLLMSRIVSIFMLLLYLQVPLVLNGKLAAFLSTSAPSTDIFADETCDYERTIVGQPA